MTIEMERAHELLLERAAELATLDTALSAVEATGRGRMVLVAGEAGIGKTSVAAAFCAGLSGVRVLSGACEALATPRPLGPFVDIADETAGELAVAVEGEASPSDVLAALLAELRRRAPTVIVLEDLHWADGATLDLLRLLARRIATAPALVVATHRDELDRRHPLRVLLGELPRDGVQRIVLAPLSVDAVATLASPHGVDGAALHDRTAGNPFYVTEALAAGGTALTDSVRDAVLARAARLDDGARALLDAVAIVPPRADLWLLEALAGDALADLEQCIASGMLRAERDAVAFRHEIARVAIEDEMAPDRRVALHRRALPALAATPRGRPDLARLAHHAEAAGDGDAVLRHAPAAAEQAARVGAHREAAAQLARALRFSDGLDAAERVDLLERRSYECYLTNAVVEAIEARRLALAEHRASGDRLRAGDAHRWLSRLAWFAGDNATAEREAAEAIEVLEPLEAGPELAMAYSNLSQLCMVAADEAGARRWGERAIALAERLELTDVLVHALNNVGAAELTIGDLAGAATLERSLALALEAGMEEHVARAYTNLGCCWVDLRDYARADDLLRDGIAYCRDRDLDAWGLYMTGWAARSQLEQGRWTQAAWSASLVLEHPDLGAPSRITALAVVGRLRARRGDPDVWTPLDEALMRARPIAELQRLVPVALARAEARWLAGEAELVAGETEEALALALESGVATGWAVGELLAWRRRAGDPAPPPDVPIAEPYRLELAGDLAAAARAWAALGCPYEAALVALGGDDEAALRASLEALQGLGARPAAARAARALREGGARDLRQGPRAATRENPAGLTARELEVLELLADGMRNAQIAERLVLSPRTVGHHVSAILRKLGTATRTEAATEAARLGILRR